MNHHNRPPGRTVPDRWRATSVSQREEYLIAASSALHDGLPAQSFYAFFTPELSLSAMCSGQGEGFAKLWLAFIIPKKQLKKEQDIGDVLYPIPNKEFETAFEKSGGRGSS